jgi:hypothetical protein
MRATKAAKAMSLTGVAILLAGGNMGCTSTPSAPSSASVSISYEDIFVLRSERKERITTSTWCTPERAGFAPLSGPSLLEDRFHFWSVETRVADGRIANVQAADLGEARACFGATESRAVFNFYLETTLSGLAISGKGDCTVVLADKPEKNMYLSRCTAPLRVASDAYVGGLLVTNSMTTSEVTFGLQTNPPGYTQVSIATVRLWRRH